MSNRFTEAAVHFVPGPLRRRPKIAVFIVCTTAVGAIGSGLAGFTDALSYFDDKPLREDQAYITHQQFNTLIIPLVNNVQRMQNEMEQLHSKIDSLQEGRQQSGTSERGPASVPKTATQPKSVGSYPAPPSERDNISDTPSLQQSLNRVRKLQMQQRTLKTNPQ